MPPTLMKNSRGVALVMVLWVMTILSVVVLEFCFSMRTEVNITRNFAEESRLYAVAQGGIQRAVAELILKNDPRMSQLRKGAAEGIIPPERREWLTDGREYRLPFEGAVVQVRVLGEAGKVNINRVSDSALRRILGTLGIEGEARDTAADSILDWRDPDDFVRVNGAENEYYQSLQGPYECKNGNFDSVEELLLVRGISRELFYGNRIRGKEGEESGEEPMGLKDIFSVYAAGEQVDINSAGLPVLRVVLGLPLEVSRLLISARAEKGFENIQELVQRVPQISPFLAPVQGLILFGVQNPYYTIEARGRAIEGNGARGIRTVVKVDRREKDGYKSIQWVDSIP